MTANRGRRPGAPGTQECILEAARQLFAEMGFERSSLRAIAQRAEVDPSLIIHYFESKEGLLAAALRPPYETKEFLAGVGENPETVGEDFVRRVVGKWDEPEVRQHIVGLIRTSMTHENAMAVLRMVMSQSTLAVLRDLAVDQPQFRSELAATQMVGLILGRYAIRLPTVAALSPDELARVMGPVLQHYLTGDLKGVSPDVDAARELNPG